MLPMLKSKASLITIVLGFLLLLSCSLEALNIKEQMAYADYLYSRFLLEREADFIKETYHYLQQCATIWPNSYEILWRLARTLNEYGEEVEQPLIYWQEGLNLAEKAVSLEPQRAEGYLWLAILKGQIGRKKGILNSLSSAKQMKELLEIVLTLESQHAYANYILSTLYRLVPGLPISFGNSKKALDYAKKAVELEPNSPFLLWNLYEASISGGEKDKAKAILEKIYLLPNYEPFAHLYNQPFPAEIKKKAAIALSKY